MGKKKNDFLEETQRIKKEQILQKSTHKKIKMWKKVMKK